MSSFDPRGPSGSRGHEVPLATVAQIRAALAQLERLPPEMCDAIVRAARTHGLLPKVTPVGFMCALCECCQAITCLVCDSDACAKCYTCTRTGCQYAAAIPRPAKTALKEWEEALGRIRVPGPQYVQVDGSEYAHGGAVETARSAGSGWGDEAPFSIAGEQHWIAVSDMTVTLNFGGRDVLTTGPGWIGVAPGDSEHREERSS